MYVIRMFFKEVPMSNLRVVNLIVSGKVDIDKPIDSRKICSRSAEWYIINEESSPILQRRFYREEKNVHGKKKCVCVSVWNSKTINITGLKSFEEGKEYYDIVMKELERLLK